MENLKPVLYLLIGAPGCGKSTWARNQQGIPIVSRDEIRLSFLKEGDYHFSKETEVFNTYVRQISDYLALGEDVIADATHLSSGSREKLLSRLYYLKFDVCCIYFHISLEKCIERNALRTGRALVPEDTVISMYRSMTKPTTTEIENMIELIEVRM